MDGSLVTVGDLVLDKGGRPRWAVTASFLGVGGSEPRCVDYRVRVVPEPPPGVGGALFEAIRAGHEVLRLMEENAISADDAEGLGTVPASGIPRYVFEQASQSRLLGKARDKVQRNPERHAESTRRLLERALPSAQGKTRVGRPPSRSLGEKLAILQDVAEEYAAGTQGARRIVAERHHMSEGALTDLLRWARHTAHPRLFTNYGPGKRTDMLTDAARELIRQGVE